MILEKIFKKNNKTDSSENLKDEDDIREKDYIVTKNDWDITPMPEKHAQFTIKRKFMKTELDILKMGHLPGEMEDRWFYYYEDGKMYFHRSWTGSCIFIVEFNLKTNKHLVTVNRDENEYTNTDIDEDMDLVNSLLTIGSNLLL